MAPMVATAEEAAGSPARAATRAPPAGVMIEIPSAALRAADLLRDVDFFSIGTNDLAQYTFAADRQLGALADLLQDPWQPALLDLIAPAPRAGGGAGKPSACAARPPADPVLACVLVGLGVTSLSMAPPALPAVRAALSRHDREQCVLAAQAAPAATSPQEARAAALSGIPARPGGSGSLKTAPRSPSPEDRTRRVRFSAIEALVTVTKSQHRVRRADSVGPGSVHAYNRSRSIVVAASVVAGCAGGGGGPGSRPARRRPGRRPRECRPGCARGRRSTRDAQALRGQGGRGGGARGAEHGGEDRAALHARAVRPGVRHEYRGNQRGAGVGTPAKTIAKYRPGGVILFPWADNVKNVGQLVALTNGLQKASPEIPLLIGADQENGQVSRLAPLVTKLPGPSTIGSTGDLSLARKATK